MCDEGHDVFSESRGESVQRLKEKGGEGGGNGESHVTGHGGKEERHGGGERKMEDRWQSCLVIGIKSGVEGVKSGAFHGMGGANDGGTWVGVAACGAKTAAEGI